ncbi:MAG: serine/threonine protein kinase [Kofleriaceae bacterium]|nr:serine/threonine protein kinase [Kofleriaceae bacterium]
MGGPPSGAGALVGQRLGKYDLLALLALGGTAEIYLARIDGHAGFEKYVVVKCLHDHLADDKDFVSMFLDEARLGAQLDHGNIVQTLGLGQQDDRYYLVMEFIVGLSLALVGRRAHERVRGGKIPVPIILNAAAQACAGLHYAHERTDGGRPLNLVHRDVSPQNLVITFEGMVKVVDFGIAKAEYRETKTRSGTVKGKFAYMSPEQCQANDVDRRTDVFAMGVICWELLTGRRLFKRDSTYETYQAVVECRVPPPSSVNHELDPALDALVMRALHKDREQRYPTAEAFGEAMIGYLHQRGKAAGPGEIARFFEEHFQPEIDDHLARMRELIEGRRASVADQKQLQWDASELDGSASVLDSELLEEIIEESVLATAPARAASTSSEAAAEAARRAATAPERPARPTPPTPTPARPPGRGRCRRSRRRRRRGPAPATSRAGADRSTRSGRTPPTTRSPARRRGSR